MRCKKNGTKIIFLPQAFGPFESRSIINNMKDVLRLADLVIARDQLSFSSLSTLSNSLEKIYLYPDFTNLLEGHLPDYFNPMVHQSCIVPNMRMIDQVKSGKVVYIEFMIFV